MNVLPPDRVRRVILGIVSFVWLPLAGLGWYAATFLPKRAPGLLRRVLVAIAAEFFLLLFLASLVGLVWAVAAPKWLEPIAQKAGGRLLLLFLLLVTGIVVLAALR